MKYRKSYMSGHVLLNLLKKFGKSDQILMLFSKEFNKIKVYGSFTTKTILAQKL